MHVLRKLIWFGFTCIEKNAALSEELLPILVAKIFEEDRYIESGKYWSY